MRRFVTFSVVILSLVFGLSYAVPAVGGPDALSSASPLSLAKKALKKANKADRRARQARKKADQALARLGRRQGFLAANVQTLSSPPKSIAQGTVEIVAVECPAGTVVVSGGYSLIGPEANVFSDRRSGNGWSVGGDNTAAADTGAGAASLTVDAQCASTGNVVISSRSERSDHRRDRQLLEQQKAASLGH
jgi:hypothetical protein